MNLKVLNKSQNKTNIKRMPVNIYNLLPKQMKL